MSVVEGNKNIIPAQMQRKSSGRLYNHRFGRQFYLTLFTVLYRQRTLHANSTNKHILQSIA